MTVVTTVIAKFFLFVLDLNALQMQCNATQHRTSLNGATVSTALVQLDSYVNGMAAVVSDGGILSRTIPTKRIVLLRMLQCS